MANLITNATYYGVTGIQQSAASDAKLAYAIPAISASVEAYLSRSLLTTRHILWRKTGQFGSIYDLEYPVQNINGVFIGNNVLQVSNLDPTFQFTISLNSTPTNGVTTVTIMSMGTGIVTTYPITSTTKYSDLVTAINGAEPYARLKIVLNDGMAMYLRPGSVMVWQGSGSSFLYGPFQPVDQDRVYSDHFKTYHTNSDICIDYVAGYDIASLPGDLQVAIAMSVRDMIQAANAYQTPRMKGERQGEYSYSVADGVSFTKFLSPYLDTYDRYLKVRY